MRQVTPIMHRCLTKAGPTTHKNVVGPAVMSIYRIGGKLDEKQEWIG